MGDNGDIILEGLARHKFATHIHFANIFASFFHENLYEDPKYLLDVCISVSFIIHLIYLNISPIKMFPSPYRTKRKKEIENYLFKLRAEIIAPFPETMVLPLCQIIKKLK